MNAKLFFLLGLAVLVARASASGFNFDQDMEKCVDESDSTVDGSSDNDGDCTLYNGFNNISTSVNSSCDSSSQVAYVTFLADIKATLSISNYSNSEKYILVSGRLDVFAAAYPTCYSVIQSINITTITNVKMIQSITIIKQQQLIFSTINLDLSDNCPLFDALRAAAEASSDSAAISATNALISGELVSICKDSSLNFTDKITEVYEKIQELLANYTVLETSVPTIQIEGFGFFSQFFQCSVVYQQQTDISVLFTGTYPDIPILAYFNATFNSLTSGSDKIKFKTFLTKVQGFLKNTTLTVEELITAIVNCAEETSYSYYAFTYQYIYSINCGAEFGSFWNICFASICPPPVIGLPITAGPTESTAATTEAVVSTSTALPSTSTACSCTCAPEL